jgi:hypothetical protein
MPESYAGGNHNLKGIKNGNSTKLYFTCNPAKLCGTAERSV